MDRKRIDQAAAQAGIAADFINAHGKRQAIEPETKRKLLAAMSRADAAQEGAASPLPAVKVFYQGAPLARPRRAKATTCGRCSVKTANACRGASARARP